MRAPLLALSLLCFAGCTSSSMTAPEGFTLAVQLQGVNASVVDTLRITISPVAEGASTPHFLMPTHGTSFEDGGVTLSVDSRGILTMTITGAYFRAHAMMDATGMGPRFEIEIWSDDMEPHAMPQVRATVVYMGDQIATGVAYLPTWPLVLGDSTTVTVPCTTGFELQCTM